MCVAHRREAFLATGLGTEIHVPALAALDEQVLLALVAPVNPAGIKMAALRAEELSG